MTRNERFDRPQRTIRPSRFVAAGLASALAVTLISPAYGATVDPRLEADLEAMRQGICDLFLAARTGHPVALQDAEAEIIDGLFDGLEASTRDGQLNSVSYLRLAAGYQEAEHLFHELPYTLVVIPGGKLPKLRISLRRHPWWSLSVHAPAGWQAKRSETGATLQFAPTE